MLPALWNDATLAAITGGPMNRLASIFDRALNEWRPFGEARGAVPAAMWENDHHIYVEAELPGMTENDIDITVQDGMLLVRGERKPEQCRTYSCKGRCLGWFERAVTLPAAVTTDGVQAELRDGVLSVALPKSAAAKQRKIAFGAGPGDKARRGSGALPKVEAALVTMALILLALVGAAS